jgi:hypothetical protein
MNTPLHTFYTNEVSPEFLRSLNDSPFMEQQLAQFDEQAQALVRQQQAYVIAHPPVAVYRWATEGSQTRNGGVVQQTTATLEFTLDNGQKVRVARKGDDVMYADGSTAQIMTGAGQDYDYLALVGSYLTNGDQIINTPQGSALYVVREGVTMAEDFLPSITG